MRRLPLVLSASALLAAAALLTACTVPQPTPTPDGSASPSASPSPSASAEPSASPSAPGSTPVSIACDALVTPQAMYDFNPNFSLLTGWSPESGTPARTAVDAQGTACRWQNDTSGGTIDISVAALDPAALEAKEAEAASGSGTGLGWFRVVGGVGEATATEGSYWVVARSPYFATPEDAEPLVDAALSALP